MLAVMLCRWSSPPHGRETRLSARALPAPTTFYTSSGTVATIVVAMTSAIGENSCARRVISQRKRANETEVTEAHCTIVTSICEWEEERHERASRRQPASAFVGPPAL